MAHKTGKLFSIPHGCANAIYLPIAIEFNSHVAASKYADVARRLGMSGEDDKTLTASLVKWIRDLNKAMNLPSSLKEFGLDESTFLVSLDDISKNAVADPCTGTNPREISVEEMKKLFIIAYYGKENPQHIGVEDFLFKFFDILLSPSIHLLQ